ncbi:hypothetical protein SERLA73DRAFT_148853 [Serpula lacrymans var. lacrymans S7.3]|uniref:Uncharacterized protein n=1 Tax=Serpula lacrymans var. lacrymans (strain S7.3) TaxID=936435 RepID=F8PFR9_SERL3|nr:hypothetical protein SERLA73DRAFT_148853 [Serpula lacrymans var. lacrymans S7.3]
MGDSTRPTKCKRAGKEENDSKDDKRRATHIHSWTCAVALFHAVLLLRKANNHYEKNSTILDRVRMDSLTVHSRMAHLILSFLVQYWTMDHVKILARILGQQPLPTELMDFHAQLVGILSMLTPADLSALLDKVAPSSMVPLSLSDSSPSVTMHQGLTTLSPARFGEEQTQADESELQTNQSLQQSLAVIRSQRRQPCQHPYAAAAPTPTLAPPARQRPCPRGRVVVQQSLWQAVNDPAIRINSAVNTFIAGLAAAHEDSSMFNSGEWAYSVDSLLTSVTSTNDYLDKSLASVVAHCWRMTSKDIGVIFLLMINYIQLVAKSQSLRSQQGISLANLWRDLPQPKPSKKQFEQWHAMGCKFAAIAAGGSIYALILVAGLNLWVQLGEIDGTTPWEIANVFRWPVGSTYFPTLRSSSRLLGSLIWLKAIANTLHRGILAITTSGPKQKEKGQVEPSRYRNIMMGVFVQTPQHTYSAVEGEGFTFEALHFSWYNRHCTKANDAPNDIPPLMMKRKYASRTNYLQLVPYTSKEIQDHTDIYQRLKTVFADLFEWINEMFATYLPAKYLVLRQHAELLPGNNASAACPFLGLVVNINVSTKAHRDAKDKLFCLVIPLDEKGGYCALLLM